MKNVFKILTLLVFVFVHQNADAQFLKKLRKKAQEKVTAIEDRVVEKLENKTDKEIDDVFEGKKREDDDDITNEESLDFENKKAEDYGDIVITHSQKFPSVEIKELSKIKVIKTNSGYHLKGNWWSHDADIFDGFSLEINTTHNLKHDKNNVNNSERQVFKIPEEATLKLGYDPQLLYYKTSEDNFKRAVTDDYQNFNISKGEVSIDVLTDNTIQISFSGIATLKTIIRNAKNFEDYTETFFETSIKGGLEGIAPVFIDNTTITKENEKNQTNTNSSSLPDRNQKLASPGVYQFTNETQVLLTTSEENRSYKMSYLFNPNHKYVGIKADMSEYTEAEMDGESVIVMDDGNAHVFVNTSGMKMQISQGQMGGNQKNPTDKMEQYDYSKIKKTGKTKIILGATCYQYLMSDDKTSMELWVAPSVNLPNWFGQNSDVFSGHIMAYSIESSEGNMTSETISINDNISKTINPKDYKKMF